MNPFFFGSSKKQLFGIHHPPKAQNARSAAILLCYPFGDEYMRTHKAMRLLTMLLTRSGFHVLRFDYFGTGDSAGEGDDATIEQWLEDIDVAADELKETSGLARISMVGLRLGGTLAARAAADRTDVDDLMLWDPVVSGTRYHEELLVPPPYLRDSSPPPRPGETVGAAGYPVAPALRTSLERLDLCTQPMPGPRRLSLVVSHERDDYARLREGLQERAGFQYQHVPGPAPWIEPEKNGGAMVLAHEIIQVIVSRLSGSQAT